MELNVFDDEVAEVTEPTESLETEAEEVVDESESTSDETEVEDGRGSRTVPLAALTAERTKYKSQIEELRAELDALKRGPTKAPEPEPEVDPEIETITALFDGLEKHPTIKQMKAIVEEIKAEREVAQVTARLTTARQEFESVTPDFREVVTPQVVEFMRQHGMLAQAEQTESPVETAYQMAKQLRSAFGASSEPAATPQKPRATLPKTSAHVSNGALSADSDDLLNAFD